MRSRKRSPKRSIVFSMRRMSMRSLPMPRIIAIDVHRAIDQSWASRLVHQRAHALDGAVEAAEDRFAHEEMADIELDDGGNGCHRRHRIEAQAMPGMAFEADRFGMGGRVDQPGQLALAPGPLGLAKSAEEQ